MPWKTLAWHFLSSILVLCRLAGGLPAVFTPAANIVKNQPKQARFKDLFLGVINSSNSFFGRSPTAVEKTFLAELNQPGDASFGSGRSGTLDRFEAGLAIDGPAKIVPQAGNPFQKSLANDFPKTWNKTSVVLQSDSNKNLNPVQAPHNHKSVVETNKQRRTDLLMEKFEIFHPASSPSKYPSYPVFESARIIAGKGTVGKLFKSVRDTEARVENFLSRPDSSRLW